MQWLTQIQLTGATYSSTASLLILKLPIKNNLLLWKDHIIKLWWKISTWQIIVAYKHTIVEKSSFGQFLSADNAWFWPWVEGCQPVGKYCILWVLRFFNAYSKVFKYCLPCYFWPTFTHILTRRLCRWIHAWERGSVLFHNRPLIIYLVLCWCTIFY